MLNKKLAAWNAGWFLIVLLLPLAAAAAEVEVLQADTAKKCSICHYRWLQTFYVDNKGTPLAPLETNRIEGKRLMCFSCHDGSVLDSREKIFNDPGHRVDNVPSSRVKIPATFPLDEKGRMQCSTCHTPHSTTRAGGTQTTFFLRTANRDSSFCKLCHEAKLGGKAAGNHPVDRALKRLPPELARAGGKSGTAQTIICETCHIPHGGVNNKLLVLSVEDPDTRSVLCETCHSKTPGQSDDASVHRTSHPIDRPVGAWVKVPKAWTGGAASVLGKKGELVCRTCHSPHGAADKNALLVERNDRDSMCVQCHSGYERIAESPHYQKFIRSDEPNIQGHRKSELGFCSPCHLAHQGAGKLMWARKGERIDSSSPGEVCKSCHRQGGAADNVLPGEHSHPMNVALPDGMPASLPVFDDRGRSPQGKIRCSTCHNFHTPQPFYDDPKHPDMKNSKFLRIASRGAFALCSSCHTRHALVEGTDHDLTVTAPLFKNSSGQAVAQAGACSACHVAHNKNKEKFLWAAPAGSAAPEGREGSPGLSPNRTVMFCTGCHSSGSIAEKAVPPFILHPREKFAEGIPRLNAQLTADLFPLFTDAGDHAENGYIVCSTCHNPHQWNPRSASKGPGREVKGNASTSFLRPNLHTRFCSVCHGKDALIKFNYFHTQLSRDKKQQPAAVSFK